MDYEKEKIKFIKELEVHKNKSDNYYKNGPGGNKVFRHGSFLDNEIIFKPFKNYFNNLNPFIFEKYLKKYNNG